MSDKLTNDLLLQIQEQQTKDSQVLHELKGNLVARVDSLESAAKWQKWQTYAINPLFSALVAIAAHFGIKVGTHP